ncbi:MAG TPA: HAMP domain-containing histidine kinase [Limosilactobacillus oris]|uniref:sensor histidine kinase n=1 Tax=Limosilactobacillus oris TaxID=1632 RepID=UPI000789E7CE|nr:HAMP domain-containing sensor histidine kinase [Limosilactobacillus oris]AMS08219.1 two-component sensor histidine kinase [Limosilactobacillus oris]HJF47146.1 HAMP domain-containing histidine kinase [Limosilactobacillus oris]
MIQHFRKKFILISTSALLVVIITIIGSISAVTYFQAQQEVNSVLSILSDNQGRMPARQVPSQSNFFPQQRFTRESLSQYRYFSATIPHNGDPIQVDNQHILSVSAATIRQLAQRVERRNNDHGQVLYNSNMYAYQVRRMGKCTLVVFLDESLMMSRAREIINLGVLLGVVSLVLYTIILVLFSRRAIRPIIEAEQRQKEFITNAGHELKTPLTVISANTEMQELTNGETELTTSTKEQVSRMTKLINYLVSLARLQEQPRMNIVPVDASAVVDRAVAGFKNVAASAGHRFEAAVAPAITVMADENYLYELVSILIDNANKYCDPDGTVSVQLATVKKNAVLTVTNSYAKGAQVNTKRFFERFYRENKARTLSKNAGYGIGLSMAQTIVHNFNGRISAKYAAGRISLVVSFRRVTK